MALFDKFNKDDLMSKIKGAANAAADKAKAGMDSVKTGIEQKKQEYEQKKAAEAERLAQMEKLAAERAEEIIAAINGYSNEKQFFAGIDKQTLLAFTKDFYDKIFMPANSVNHSKISMHPYIDAKELGKLALLWPALSSDETPLILISPDKKQRILITDKNLYFALTLAEDANFLVKGSVSGEQIGTYTAEKADAGCIFKCDEYVLASFAPSKTVSEDFVTLTNYFSCIEKKDFTITDEEVDSLIRTKIGENVYAEVKKYLAYDDELMVYFAWGIDSLSAKDYIVCTTKQIIIIDREMLGTTANIKQFYYEDITSASAIQNSTSNDLTVALIESAITAATKTCDLVLNVTGTTHRINTLFKVEVERIVAVYHHYRKMAKTASAQPQVIVQQPQTDVADQLKKFKDLLDAGVLTQEEFDAKKKQLLGL